MKTKIIFILLSMLLIFCGCDSREELRILNKGIIGQSSNQSEDDTTSAGNLKGTYEALNYDEQKAVWISYIELADFLAEKDEESFVNEFTTAIDNIKKSGFNTVYVHVRAFSDAYYDSLYYPVSYTHLTLPTNSLV